MGIVLPLSMALNCLRVIQRVREFKMAMIDDQISGRRAWRMSTNLATTKKAPGSQKWYTCEMCGEAYNNNRFRLMHRKSCASERRLAKHSRRHGVGENLGPHVSKHKLYVAKAATAGVAPFSSRLREYFNKRSAKVRSPSRLSRRARKTGKSAASLNSVTTI